MGTMVMNVIGKSSCIGLQKNPGKSKERKDSPSLLKTKAPHPGYKKTAGDNFALSGYTYEPICLPKEATILPVIAEEERKPVHSQKAKQQQQKTS